MTKAAKRSIEYMALGEIQEAEKNPKTHALVTLRQSVRRFGVGETPMLDERTKRLVAGHGRLQALKALKNRGKKPPEGVELRSDGEWLVPVQRGWSSKDDVDARAYLIASNRTSEVGGWNQEQLEAELESLADEGMAALAGVGYDEAYVEKMLGEADDDEAPEPATQGGFRVLVMCDSEEKQAALLMKLTEEGFECRSLIS